MIVIKFIDSHKNWHVFNFVTGRFEPWRKLNECENEQDAVSWYGLRQPISQDEESGLLQLHYQYMSVCRKVDRRIFDPEKISIYDTDKKYELDNLVDKRYPKNSKLYIDPFSSFYK